MFTQVYLSQNMYPTLLGLSKDMSKICRYIPFTECALRYTHTERIYLPQGMSNTYKHDTPGITCDL